MPDELIGTINEFFARPVVAGIDLSGKLKTGDTIKIKGHTTDMEVRVESMQIDNNMVTEAGPGDSVGVKVKDRVRRGDLVFRVN